MINFYRVNFVKSNPDRKYSYFKNLELNITDNLLTIISDGKTFKYTIADLRARWDASPFSRFVFAFDKYVDSIDGRYLKYNGEVFNHLERNKITKQKVKDQSLVLGQSCKLNVWVTPEAQDFSELTFALHAYPEEEIKITGVDVKIIPNDQKLFLWRELAPKFKIEGFTTIQSNTKQTYTIVYDKDVNANFRVKFGNNIGIINKKDTYLVKGKTKITVDASDLDIGEEIQLEVGTYEFTNTSRINIRVI
jgi:hypothetical protein